MAGKGAKDEYPRTESDGVSVTYRLYGAGDAKRVLLALHCSGASGGQWRDLAPFCPEGTAIVAPDLIGYGNSGFWHGLRPITLADEAALALAALKASGLGDAGLPVHVLGHSYGGAVALNLVASGRINVASLTLVEPVAFHLLRMADDPALKPVDDVVAAIRDGLDSGDYAHGAAGFVDYWGGDGAWDALSDRVRTATIAAVRTVLLNFHAAICEETGLADYARLDLPVSLQCGEKTTAAAHRMIQLLTEAFPDVRLSMVEGGGHMAAATDQARVFSGLAAFLQAAEGKARANAA